MKRVLIALTLCLLLTSVVSAEMLIKTQPDELYNLGQVIKIPTKITTNEGIDEFFTMNLICNGIETEVHKQYISLPIGEEQEILVAIPLITSFIGRSTGTCKAKAIIGESFILTNEFKISDQITVELEDRPVDMLPGEDLIFEGTAIKENGQNVKGFIDLIIKENNETKVSIQDTVQNGYFYLNASLPSDTAAGQYLVSMDVFETEKNGNISNKGFVDYNLNIAQVPTSLEIIFENSEVVPGSPLKVKAILHDQTGEKIESQAQITIKNENDKLLDQIDIATDEFLEYPIASNYPPSEWTILAKSNDLEAEDSFEIIENEKANIIIANKTVFLQNIGNVPYNETVIVKIGNSTINFDAYIPIDEEQKYGLTAPEGEYEVEVISEGGDNKVSASVLLTGKAISVRESGTSLLGAIRLPFVWIFMIAVLGFMAFMIYKKGYKRSFIGYIGKKIKRKKGAAPLKKDSLISPTNPAEMSLSIKGEQQNTSIILLKIKNFREVMGSEASKELLQEIADKVEEEKAVTYENRETIVFLLAPIKTKTFKTGKPAVELAQKVKSILDSYNKLAKEKIVYGIALNYGVIVAKSEKDSLKFMSMGTLMTTAKKLANLAENDIYLSEKLNDRVMSDVKTEKHERHSQKVYTITEIRKKSKTNEKFIHNFIRKLEKENKEKAEAKEKKK